MQQPPQSRLLATLCPTGTVAPAVHSRIGRGKLSDFARWCCLAQRKVRVITRAIDHATAHVGVDRHPEILHLNFICRRVRYRHRDELEVIDSRHTDGRDFRRISRDVIMVKTFRCRWPRRTASARSGGYESLGPLRPFTHPAPHRVRALGLPSRNRHRRAPWAPRSPRSPRVTMLNRLHQGAVMAPAGASVILCADAAARDG